MVVTGGGLIGDFAARALREDGHRVQRISDADVEAATASGLAALAI